MKPSKYLWCSHSWVRLHFSLYGVFEFMIINQSVLTYQHYNYSMLASTAEEYNTLEWSLRLLGREFAAISDDVLSIATAIYQDGCSSAIARASTSCVYELLMSSTWWSHIAVGEVDIRVRAATSAFFGFSSYGAWSWRGRVSGTARRIGSALACQLQLSPLP